MGWYYSCGATKKSIIAKLTENREWNNPHGSKGRTVVHRKCVRGNVLWTIQENFVDDKTTGKWIGCYLLGSSNRDWGYKAMEESVHPYYYTCPLSWLDEVPVSNAKWRECVRKYHNERKIKFKLKVGQVISLKKGYEPSQVTIKSVRPLLAYGGSMLYRVPRKAVDSIVQDCG